MSDAVQTLVTNSTVNITGGSGMEIINVETTIILHNTVTNSGAVGIGIDKARGTTFNFNTVVNSVSGTKLCNALITSLVQSRVVGAEAGCFDQCGETDISL